jgi:hypothetical protein
MKNWSAKIWLAALALQLSPCMVGAAALPAAESRAAAAPSLSSEVASGSEMVMRTDEVPPAVGTLTLQWTISGRREPIDCGGLGVERLALSLRAPPADEEQAEGQCDAFQLSMDLPPGSYSGDAVLIDRFDRPVTLAVPLDSVDIVAGREVVKTIDFPVAAFL